MWSATYCSNGWPLTRCDDVARQADAVVRVARNLARRKEPLRLISDEEVAQGHLPFRVGNDDVPAFLFETAGVGHQVAQGDGLAEGGADLEVEIAVDVGIEVELALLLELHNGNPCKELGDGREPENRRHRVDGSLLLLVGVSVALLQQHVAIFHHQDRRAGDIRALQLHLDNSVEEGLKVRRLESMRPRRGCGRSLLFGMRLRGRRTNGCSGLRRLRPDWQDKKKPNSISHYATKAHATLRCER